MPSPAWLCCLTAVSRVSPKLPVVPQVVIDNILAERKVCGSGRGQRVGHGKRYAASVPSAVGLLRAGVMDAPVACASRVLEFAQVRTMDRARKALCLEQDDMDTHACTLPPL